MKLRRLRPRRLLARLRINEQGASTVEFALVLPIFLFVVLASMQLAFLAIVRYDVKHVTRETARWLAVNPDSTDATVLAHVTAEVLPGMVATNVVSAGVAPACAALSGGHCASRPPGTVYTVSVVYDASNVYFMPNFGPSLTFGLSSTQLSSQVSMVVE